LRFQIGSNMDRGVERLGGREVPAERLFHDEPAPACPVPSHGGAFERLDRGLVQLWRDCQIEEAVRRGGTLFEPEKPLSQADQSLCRADLSGYVMQVPRELVPFRSPGAEPFVLLDLRPGQVAIGIVGVRGPR
jgi:hypothetical protein